MIILTKSFEGYKLWISQSVYYNFSYGNTIVHCTMKPPYQYSVIQSTVT